MLDFRKILRMHFMDNALLNPYKELVLRVNHINQQSVEINQSATNARLERVIFSELMLSENSSIGKKPIFQ